MCSSRKPRFNPQAVDFVLETLKEWMSAQPADSALSTAKAEPKIIDLAAWNLPMFDEPGIPSQIHDHSKYEHEHTRAWSQEIRKHSAFIFVTPQYNWGYPAVLKNAIDYLFNEWKGKPALIVSYGGHGGGKASAQLREVLNGIQMKVVDAAPGFTFGSRETMFQAAAGKPVATTGQDSIWSGERGGLKKAFEELGALVN